YCHHPTEIRATLSAARLRNPARLWGIFQPHRYTRTAHLMDEFAGCFAGCDRLSVLDIYPASESPIPGITAESLVERIRKEGIESVHHAPDSSLLIEQIVQEAQPGDLILTMGAGSVTNLAGELARALEAALAARQVTQP
ncbi:MAG: UDP-N-acetylmuramate--L-alanine ligase, partial [Acidobacteria bacterium]|nr:UDP-N-acetylmuramate--L-alanine ligase [Acidobacteriota bacterium]